MAANGTLRSSLSVPTEGKPLGQQASSSSLASSHRDERRIATNLNTHRGDEILEYMQSDVSYKTRNEEAGDNQVSSSITSIQDAIAEMLTNIRASTSQSAESGNKYVPAGGSKTRTSEDQATEQTNAKTKDSEKTSDKGNKIKRPMNAFMVWAREYRQVLSKGFPKESNSQISVRLGDIWSNLTSEEKQPFYDKADRLRRQHEKDYPDWVYQPNKRKRTSASLPQAENRVVMATAGQIRGILNSGNFGQNFQVQISPPLKAEQVYQPTKKLEENSRKVSQQSSGLPHASTQQLNIMNIPQSQLRQGPVTTNGPSHTTGPHFQSPKRPAIGKVPVDESPLAADKFHSLLSRYPMTSVLGQLSPEPQQKGSQPPFKHVKKQQPLRPKSSQQTKTRKKGKQASPETAPAKKVVHIKPNPPEPIKQGQQSWNCTGVPIGGVQTLVYSPYPSAAASIQVRPNNPMPLGHQGQPLLQIPAPSQFVTTPPTGFMNMHQLTQQSTPRVLHHGNMMSPVSVVHRFPDPLSIRPDYSQPPPPLALPVQPGVMMNMYPARPLLPIMQNFKPVTHFPGQVVTFGPHVNINNNQNNSNSAGINVQNVHSNTPSNANTNNSNITKPNTNINTNNISNSNNTQKVNSNTVHSTTNTIHNNSNNNNSSNNNSNISHCINISSSKNVQNVYSNTVNGTTNTSKNNTNHCNSSNNNCNTSRSSTICSTNNAQNVNNNTAKNRTNTSHNNTNNMNSSNNSRTNHNNISSSNTIRSNISSSNYAQKAFNNTINRTTDTTHNNTNNSNSSTNSSTSRSNNVQYVYINTVNSTTNASDNSNSSNTRNNTNTNTYSNTNNSNTNRSYISSSNTISSNISSSNNAQNVYNNTVNCTTNTSLNNTNNSNPSNNISSTTSRSNNVQYVYINTVNSTTNASDNSNSSNTSNNTDTNTNNSYTNTINTSNNKVSYKRDANNNYININMPNQNPNTVNYVYGLNNNEIITSTCNKVTMSYKVQNGVTAKGSQVYTATKPGKSSNKSEKSMLPPQANPPTIRAGLNLNSQERDEKSNVIDKFKQGKETAELQQHHPDNTKETQAATEISKPSNGSGGLAPLPRKKSFLQTLNTPMSSTDVVNQLARLIRPPSVPYGATKKILVPEASEDSIENMNRPLAGISTYSSCDPTSSTKPPYPTCLSVGIPDQSSCGPTKLPPTPNLKQSEPAPSGKREIVVSNHEEDTFFSTIDDGNKIFKLTDYQQNVVTKEGKDGDDCTPEMKSFVPSSTSAVVLSSPNVAVCQQGGIIYINDSFSPASLKKDGIPHHLLQSSYSSSSSDGSFQLADHLKPIDLSIVSIESDTSIPQGCEKFLLDMDSKEILVNTQGWDMTRCEEAKQGPGLGDKKMLVQLRKAHEDFIGTCEGQLRPEDEVGS